MFETCAFIYHSPFTIPSWRVGALRGCPPQRGVPEDGANPPKHFVRRGFTLAGGRGEASPLIMYGSKVMKDILHEVRKELV